MKSHVEIIGAIMDNIRKLNKNSLISVVVPVYNEEQNLREFYSRLSQVLGKLELQTVVVFVDDGSTDSSLSIMKEFQAGNSNVEILCLSRNFGHQIALTAGLDYANGDVVVTIDADLQDPPELIIEMLSEWKKGYDVVNTVRESREGERMIKIFIISLFYWFLQKISQTDLSMAEGDFRLIDRKVVDHLKQIKERNRYIRGLLAWIGYKHTTIKYKRDKRAKGKSKYSLYKYFVLAVDAITTFSYFPLRLISALGFFISFFAVGLLICVVFLKLFAVDIDLPGYAVFFVSIALLGGLQLIVFGILGEYLGRCFEEVRNRPLYFVKDFIKSNSSD